MFDEIETPREKAMRERIARLEITLGAYDRMVHTTTVDAYRKRIAGLESALTDVLYPRIDSDPIKILIKRGLSPCRATQIIDFLTNFHIL